MPATYSGQPLFDRTRFARIPHREFSDGSAEFFFFSRYMPRRPNDDATAFVGMTLRLTFGLPQISPALHEPRCSLYTIASDFGFAGGRESAPARCGDATILRQLFCATAMRRATFDFFSPHCQFDAGLHIAILRFRATLLLSPYYYRQRGPGRSRRCWQLRSRLGARSDAIPAPLSMPTRLDSAPRAEIQQAGYRRLDCHVGHRGLGDLPFSAWPAWLRDAADHGVKKRR